MLTLQLLKSRKNKQFWMAEILHHLGCQPNFEIMGVAGGSIKDAIMHDMAGGAGFQPSTEWTLLVLLLFAPGQGLFIAHETNIVIHIHVTIYGACKRSTWQVQAFPVFFQLHILPCSFLQLHSSCIPVANSSCKFYLHWGKHSQARQSLKSSLLVLCWLFFAPANASPNVNRICNWNLQLECNCRKLHRRICNWKNTGKTQATVLRK